MQPSREEIMQALFKLLKNADGFVSYSRRMAQATDVPEKLQPALIMYEVNEKNRSTSKGTPPINYLFVKVIILAKVPHSTKWSPDQRGGAEILNPLMDAVEAAVTFDPFGGLQTLGNLVERVIWDEEDETIKDVGDTDANGQAIAIMPLKIIVP
jgi:hypothetical protein